MICPRCGTINADGIERCTRCRGSLAPPPPREKVDVATADSPAPVAVKLAVPAPSESREGRDAIPAAPGSPPPPASWSPPAETPTWPPPWPAPTGSPWSPPPGPPADAGQWPPPPPAPPGQWPPPAPPPPGAPPPGQWPPPPTTPPGQWPPPTPQGLGRARGDTAKPNYLPWAVLCTLLFNIIGIVAIVYCVVANRRFAAGDVDGGMHATQLARTWCWISVIVGLIGLLLLASGVIHFPPSGG